MTNSTVVGFSGLRGGVGTTSMTALLAAALHHSGQSVLVVDLNDSDLLRLHFNVPYADAQGWAAVFWDGGHWESQIRQIQEGLYVLPFGRNATRPARVNAQVTGSMFEMVLDTLQSGRNSIQPDWVIFDLPSQSATTRGLQEQCDLHFLVCEPDYAAHVLLDQYELMPQTHLLLNKLTPKEPLGSAIVMDWKERYAERVVPVSFTWDAHISESLAHKCTVLMHAPESITTQKAYEFAHWCLSYPEKD